jgi:N-acetylmuramic acid 6-phosphate etherase
MIKIGRVEGNRMVNMQLSNEKLIQRGVKMIQDASGIAADKAHELLLKHNSVKAVLESLK